MLHENIYTITIVNSKFLIGYSERVFLGQLNAGSHSYTGTAVGATSCSFFRLRKIALHTWDFQGGGGSRFRAMAQPDMHRLRSARRMSMRYLHSLLDVEKRNGLSAAAVADIERIQWPWTCFHQEICCYLAHFSEYFVLDVSEILCTRAWLFLELL